MNIFRNLNSQTSIKIALLLIPYLGLFGVHVVGMTSHSNKMLHQFFDVSTYAQLFTEFSLHALFAFSMARLIWFLSRGLLLLLAQILNFAAGKHGISWRKIRIITIMVARSSQFNGLVVAAIAFWIFCRTYLGMSTINSAFYLLFPILTYGLLIGSEEKILIAAKHVRGDQNVRFRFNAKGLLTPRPTLDEERVGALLMAKVTKNTGQILLMTLLVGTWTSYSMGKVRNAYLRTELAFKDQDGEATAVIAKTINGFIIWRPSTNSYSLYARDALLSLPIDNSNN